MTSYLPALVAEFNNLSYHLHESREECASAETSLSSFMDSVGSPSIRTPTDTKTIREAEAYLEGRIARFSALVSDVGASYSLIKRCEAMLARDGIEGAALSKTALMNISVGELKTTFGEADSELAQLAIVCVNSESYPDLGAGKAVLRRSQLLDLALARRNMPPVFLRLTEEQQLKVGNAFLRAIGSGLHGAGEGNASVRAAGSIEANQLVEEELGRGLRAAFGGHEMIPQSALPS